MKKRALYGACLVSTIAVALVSLCCRLRHYSSGRESSISVQSASLPMLNAKYTFESVTTSAKRLKDSDMADSAGIAVGMLAILSTSQDMFVRKEDILDLLGAAEELESRRIVLSNGVSVTARDFARLEGNDFNSAVNALCSLRLFCAKASARLEGVGDVASELWLVYYLTRAKAHLAKSGMAERQKLIDSWLDSVWTFVDSRECNAYKATRKLWDDGLRHIRVGGVHGDWLKAFVDQVRRNFIDRIDRMGDGHLVPWSVEFTADTLREGLR